MSNYSLRETDSANVVRVMTIHKSKGLGFDVVVLPDLERNKLDQARDGLAVRRTDDHEVEWVLDMPTKDLVDRDEVLAEQMRAAESAGCYESLSLLYVAMTRAKRGLYLVIKPPGKSTSRNFTKLLNETLEGDDDAVVVGNLSFPGVFSSGDPEWYRALEASEQTTRGAESFTRLDPQTVNKSTRLVARRPSDGKSGVWPAADLFALKLGHSALEFGRRVHGLLAEVEWIDHETLLPLRAKWADGGDAEQHALECLEAAALVELWTQPERGGLWRERMFEMVLDGVWITGVFDRVVIQYDPGGKPKEAHIYDFKTDDSSEGAVERHQRQLNLYREAAARLLGLPLMSVRCSVVMTRTQQCIEVPIDERRTGWSKESGEADLRIPSD